MKKNSDSNPIPNPIPIPIAKPIPIVTPNPIATPIANLKLAIGIILVLLSVGCLHQNKSKLRQNNVDRYDQEKTSSLFSKGEGFDQNSPFSQKAQYGPLDRLYSPYMGEKNAFISEAVGILLPIHLFGRTEDQLWKLNLVKLKSLVNLCVEEPDQLKNSAAGSCTAFLVGPNKMVTAGHCFSKNESGSFEEQAARICASSVVVFDYKVDSRRNVKTEFSREDIYFCKNVKYVVSNFDQDVAFFELERTVDRPKLRIDLAELNSIQTGQELRAFGHPLGFPLTLTRGKVEGVFDFAWLATSLDTFQGNSGSPVLNDADEVIGLLSQGGADFSYDNTEKCYRKVTCASYNPDSILCRGEIVYRFGAMPNFTNFLRD